MFVINKDYAAELERKKRVFQEKTDTRKAVFLAMITPYGVEKNAHYFNTVDNQLCLDDLFD